MDNNFNQNENAGNENNMAGYSTGQPNNQGSYNGAYNQQPNGNQAYGQNAYNNQQQQYGQPNYNQNMNGYNNQNMNGYNNQYNNGYNNQANPYNNVYGNTYTNAFAIVGMIAGIVSICFLGYIFGILGLIFSILGQKNAIRYTGTKSGMATAGFICSIIGIVIWGIVLIVQLAAVATYSYLWYL